MATNWILCVVDFQNQLSTSQVGKHTVCLVVLWWGGYVFFFKLNIERYE